jgi:hypothetical protein
MITLVERALLLVNQAKLLSIGRISKAKIRAMLEVLKAVSTGPLMAVSDVSILITGQGSVPTKSDADFVLLMVTWNGFVLKAERRQLSWWPKPQSHLETGQPIYSARRAVRQRMK